MARPGRCVRSRPSVRSPIWMLTSASAGATGLTPTIEPDGDRVALRMRGRVIRNSHQCKAIRTRINTAAVFVVVMLTGLLWNHWSFFVLFSIVHFGY